MLGNYKRTDDGQFYFIGGGIGSLTGAAYLLRDCGFDGKNIHIIETLPIMGGSNDAKGNPEDGWIMRGERMLNRQTYENFWDIYSSIPSLVKEGMSVTDEIFEHSEIHKSIAKARFFDENGEIMDTSSYGLNKAHLMQLINLWKSTEVDLDDITIEDWFDEAFFDTIFWYAYEATFAFQPWSSVMEFRRYTLRFWHLILKLITCEGVSLTPNSQYETLIEPVMAVLEEAGVDFIYNTSVIDMDFAEGDGITVTGLKTVSDGQEGYIPIRENDNVITTLGCMTDNATFGSKDTPATLDTSYPVSATLWKNISKKKAGLGNPDKFFSHPDKSAWMSFNCTFKGHTFTEWLEKYTHNKTGEGLTSTFVKSPWVMELRLQVPGFFKNQPEDYDFVWMCAFNSYAKGEHYGKSEFDCTGMEILDEILLSLPMDEETRQKCRDEVVAAIPVAMPYIDAQFLPRSLGDRPDVVPAGSTNLGFTGQFCEVPEDVVFTEEYSVRASRMAVYQLTGSRREVAPVKPIRYDARMILGAAVQFLK
ncbi:67 kDa Myosin-crossreactive streptococcal antigen [Streptococcus gallolyticus]|uniref:67 kDa Myosin-crossreactive streptococcal antigen n=1 Tax=Streptococcus gallolyticus TaxID=315405 RepID=A0AA94M164_9STRE|nr:oleate hydratase [Streptococcus gallolyticus]AQP41317.1 putative myosin-cross-reactive antigen [Streptococcus gallolyticus subsp. gallolyticus DSM 16831]SQG78599.1 67 kDa Myosin-crossreactive streptococcal antigen [Streptococcus gallolyticus]